MTHVCSIIMDDMRTCNMVMGGNMMYTRTGSMMMGNMGDMRLKAQAL